MKKSDYWSEVLQACNDVKDSLGAFPPPTLATVGAAEIVKLLLKTAGTNAAPYEGTMACSVVQLHDLISGQQTFVVAFSGYHPKLKLDLAKGTRELKEAFEDLKLSTDVPPRFWYCQNPPSHYVPLHLQTRDYFKNNLKVEVDKRLITYDDVKDFLDFEVWKQKVFEGRARELLDVTAVQGTREVGPPGKKVQQAFTTYVPQYGDETGAFSYAYRGSSERIKPENLFKKKDEYIGLKPVYDSKVQFQQVKGEITEFLRGLLSTFLALRMDLIRGEDVSTVVKAARGLLRQLKGTQHAVWVKLAAYLDQVLVAPRLTAEQLTLEQTMDAVRQQVAPETPPEDLRDTLYKRERKVLKKSLKLTHWKDVPAARFVNEHSLVAARKALKKPTSGDLVSKRNELVNELQGDALLADLIPQVWAASGAGPNGQFCAEPKAFDFVRNGGLIDRGIDEGKSRFVIVGQLALWHSGGDAPRNFSNGLLVKGPEGATDTPASGGYMLPCSSCAARSALMMEGVQLQSTLVNPPDLYAPLDFQLRERCVVCKKETKLCCAQCRSVFYCGKEHQKKDWTRHKRFCAPKR